MTPAQALTAPLDELRDWLAGEDGWKYESGPVWQWRRYINGARVDQLDAVSDDHPHPPTLAAMTKERDAQAEAAAVKGEKE